LKVGANLSEQQKEVLKKQILQEFPNLSMFATDIDFLIEEYSKDKKYVSKLMQTKDPVQTVIDESKLEVIRIVKSDTQEWKEITEKMEKSKEEFIKIVDDDEEKPLISI
jgi:predicted DNA-binding protein (UPF0251 family)